MHVIGDYLYVVYTQRNGGNPCICKYDIKNYWDPSLATRPLMSASYKLYFVLNQTDDFVLANI